MFERRTLSQFAMAGLLLLVVASSALAQRSRSSGREREDVTLTTKDGVKVVISYFPSDSGKEAVPVVMLHDYKESRAVFNSIASELHNPSDPRRESRAVITVDLRGHGDSTTQVAPNGRSRELDASRLRAGDFIDMVVLDMEAVRKFLVTKNDAGELNLNKLCVLGSGMGANIAAAWATRDWSVPPLAIKKQGQDVKALVLASPKWKYQGIAMLDALRHPAIQRQVSFLIVYGQEDSSAKKSAENIYENLERYHPEPPRDQVREKKMLFTFPLPTRLQGTKLLTDRDFNMLIEIDLFLHNRLASKDFEWISRRRD